MNNVIKKIIDNLKLTKIIEEYDLFNGYFIRTEKYGAKNLLQILYVYDNEKESLKKYEEKAAHFKKKYENKLYYTHFFKSVEYKSGKTAEDKDFYYLIFTYDDPVESEDDDLFLLSQENIWDEKSYKFKDIDKIRERLKKEHLLNLLKDIEILHQNSEAFSYLSPLNIILEPNKPKWFFPFLTDLIKPYGDTNSSDKKNNNYKAIYNENKDLNIYCYDKNVLANNFPIEPHSDIWSLGVLFSLIEYNKKPFMEDDEADYITNTGTVNLDLENSKFGDIIRKCLNINPDNRCSISDIIKDLKNLEKTDEEFEFHVAEDTNEIISYNDKSIEIKPNKETEVEVILKINEDTFPQDIKLIFDNINDQSARGIIEQNIEILQKPELNLIDNKCSLYYEEGTEGNEYKGTIYFEVKKSRVKINKINIEIKDNQTSENSNDKSANEVKIQHKNFELKNILPKGEYHFTFLHNLSKEEQKTIIISFELAYLNDFDKIISQSVTLLPKKKINLKFKDSITGRNSKLSLLTNGSRAFELEFSNYEDGINIEKISIEPDSNFIQFKLQKEEKKINISVQSDDKAKVISGSLYVEYSQTYENGDREVYNIEIPFHVNIIKPEQINKRFAVDFGTTNSCIAVSNPESTEAELFLFNELYKQAEEDPKRTIPSVIYYENLHEIFIGPKAKVYNNSGKDNAFTSFKSKLNMNKGVDEDIEFIYLQDSSSYERSWFNIISDYLYKMITELAEVKKIAPVEVIFTHPINLKNEKLTKFKEITENAVKKVYPGQNNIEFKYIDEATAAVIGSLSDVNWDKDKDEEKKAILVYDFGGGTTDIVFAEIVKSPYTDDFGDEYSIHELIPYYSKGYLVGGDDINKIYIKELVELVKDDKDKKGFIPHAYLLDDYAMNRITDKEIRTILLENTAVLWQYSEMLKTNSDKDSDGILKHVEGNKVRPTEWKKVDHNTVIKDTKVKTDVKIDENFKNKVDKSVKDLLKSIIKDTTEVLNKYKEKFYRITIILTGQASLYPLVKDIFNYIINEESENDYRDDFDKIKSNGKIELLQRENAEELKGVVVKGALKSISTNIKINNNVLLNDIYRNSGDKPYFVAGTKKIDCVVIEGIIGRTVDEITKRLDDFIKEDDAIKKVEFKGKKTVNIQFRDAFRFNITKSIDMEFQENDLLYLFVDTNDKIRYVLISKNKSEVEWKEF